MWVRRMVSVGDSLMVSLPVEVTRALKWERGDYLYVVLHDERELRFMKFNPAQVSDRERAALEPLPTIQHD